MSAAGQVPVRARAGASGDGLEEVDLFSLGGHEVDAVRGAPDASSVLADLGAPRSPGASADRRIPSYPAAPLRHDASGPRLKLTPPSVPPARPSAPPSQSRLTLPPVESPSAQPPGAFAAASTLTMRPRRAPPLGLLAVLVGVVVVGAAIAVRLLGSASGTLVLSVDPPAAQVALDGAPIVGYGSFLIEGVSPERTHLLVVRHAGYETWHAPIQLRPGQRFELPRVALIPQAAPLPPSAP